MTPLTKKYGLNVVNCAAAVAEAKKAGRFVNVMRPSKWGNPFMIGPDGTRTEVLKKYREYVLTTPALIAALPELRGMMLGCACLPLPCHVEILIELANAKPFSVMVPVTRADELSAALCHTKFATTVSSICRCGKEFHVGHQDGEPMLLHEMPYCKEFERMDLVPFLRWNRGATEN